MGKGKSTLAVEGEQAQVGWDKIYIRIDALLHVLLDLVVSGSGVSEYPTKEVLIMYLPSCLPT